MRRQSFIVAACLLVGGCQSVFAEGPATRLSAGPTPPAVLLTNPTGEQHWFGVAVEPLPPAISRQLKLQEQQGLMVMAVLPQSPAERAALRAEDILIEIDGHPLMSQKELAHAANALEDTKNGPISKISRITFLREGARKFVDIMPELRPDNMIVLGKNTLSFTSALPGQQPADPDDVRNYILPNGTAAQVGPGYRVNLDAGDTVTVKSIRSIVKAGKPVVLVQETDNAGILHNSINVAGQTYIVEAGKLDALPPELRPIGEQLLASVPNTQTNIAFADVAATTPHPAPAPTARPLEERVKDLEAQNAELQKKIDALTAELKKSPPAK